MRMRATLAAQMVLPVVWSCTLTDLDDLGTASAPAASTTGAGGGGGHGGAGGAAGCGATEDNSAHCGACGHDCLGAVCMDSVCEPTVLADEQNLPSCIGLDSSHVYWGTENSAGQARSTLKSGGSSIQDYAPSGTIDEIHACAVGGGYFYAVESDGVHRYQIPTAAHVSIVYSQMGMLHSIALDDGSPLVFVTNRQLGTVISCAGECGSMPTLIDSGQAEPYRIAADATHLYWTNAGDGTVMRRELAGAEATAIAGDQTGPGGIAHDATHVYWANKGGTIMKFAKNGGTPTVLATTAPAPENVALDDTHVYWTNPSEGTVMKIAKEGGSPLALANNQAMPWDLAVDGTHVYWVNQIADFGSVQRVAK